MADLVSQAIDKVRQWDAEDPASMLQNAARLLRYVLDSKKHEVPGWSELCEATEVSDAGTPDQIDQRLARWDTLSDQLVAAIREDRYAMQQLGIVAFVTRTVSAWIHRDSRPDRAGQTFEEWRERLCHALDKCVGFYR